MDALTSKLYTAMKDGPTLNVTGQLAAGEHIWNVAVFLYQRPDGRWRLGRPSDTEIYVLNHVHASIPPRHGPNRTASNRDRRSLLNQIYTWIDEQCGYAPEVPSKSQDAPVMKEIRTMANQCAIIMKWGLGERCKKEAVEGDPRGRCKLHVHLETLCGELPTTKGDFRPERLKKAAKVADRIADVTAAVVPVSAPVVPEGAVARMTPDALAEAIATEPAPSTPAQKSKKHVKKSTKKGASPKA
jgi:hypothetical protein